MTFFILLFCINLIFSVLTYCSIFSDLLFEVPFSYNNYFLLYFIFIYFLLSFFLYLSLLSLLFTLFSFLYLFTDFPFLSLLLCRFLFRYFLFLFLYFFYSNRRMTAHLRNVGQEFLK